MEALTARNTDHSNKVQNTFSKQNDDTTPTWSNALLVITYLYNIYNKK